MAAQFTSKDHPLLEQAEMSLERLSNQEVLLIRETEDLFKRAQLDHIRRIDKLQNSIPNMEKIGTDINRLSSLVESASSLVDDACGEFRRIDLAKARVEDAIAKLDDILDLRTSQLGVSQAMKLDNYEEAAMHIKRYLAIDQDRLLKTIHAIHAQRCGVHVTPISKVSPLILPDGDLEQKDSDDALIDQQSIKLALDELDTARSRLFKLCNDNFIRAIKENDTKDIERFFKLFPMLNEHQVGLNKYAEYLQGKIVNQQVDETFNSRQANQADKLASLYESLAKLVDSHQPLIETYYGPGKLIVVVRVLQKECDRLSRKILEEFRNETKLQSVAKVVRTSSMQSTNPASNANFQAPTQNLNPSKLDPRNIDNILNEISLIISRSEVYLNFVIQRLKDDLNSNCENEAQKQAGLLELYNLIGVDCELNHLVQEVGGIYVMLEQFYLNESSKKAILIDQIDLDLNKCFVSSMLDDIFFIIKKCTKRAISTRSTEVFCAIINHCVTLLGSTFCQVLDERIKNHQYHLPVFTSKNLDLSQAYSVIQSGRYLQSSSELENAKAQYFSALNNLNKACDYIQTLKGILDIDIKKLKPSLLLLEKQQDSQIEKSATCLNELNQLIMRFGSIVNGALYQLFNAALRNRLRSELKTIITENPDLANSPEEVVNSAKHLLEGLDKSLLESLTPENCAKLVQIAKEFLGSSMKTMK